MLGRVSVSVYFLLFLFDFTETLSNFAPSFRLNFARSEEGYVNLNTSVDGPFKQSGGNLIPFQRSNVCVITVVLTSESCLFLLF